MIWRYLCKKTKNVINAIFLKNLSVKTGRFFLLMDKQIWYTIMQILTFIRRSKMTIKIDAIPSKSIYHRAAICNFISSLQGYNESKLKIMGNQDCLSQDIKATKESLDRIGALFIAITKAKQAGRPIPEYIPLLHVKESGATLRFLIPLLGALGLDGEFRMEGRLIERPINPLLEIMKCKGCSFFVDYEKKAIKCQGKLLPGVYNISGEASSQFASGLLMALPLLEGESTMIISKPIKSRDYIEMTLNVLNDFRVGIIKMDENNDYVKYSIPGGQQYGGPKVYNIEGDWSGGAFWLAVEEITGKNILVNGLNPVSKQADRRIVKFMSQLKKEEPIEIDGINNPDLIPILSVLALKRKTQTTFKNIGALRFKESDRVEGIAEVIETLGGICNISDEEIIIEPLKEEINSDSIDSKESKERENQQFIYISTWDHRMVMMVALASLISKDAIILEGWKSIKKSYPTFFKELHKAGLDYNIGLA